MNLIDRSSNLEKKNIDKRHIDKRHRKSRLIILVCVFTVWVLLVAQRLLNLQILDVEKWNQWAVKQHNSKITIAGKRGSITDRFDKLLALSVPSGSVYVRPALIKDREFATKALVSLMSDLDSDVTEENVKSKLSSKKPFVWIKRQIPKVKAESVKELGIRGLDYVLEAKRYYPLNSAASRIIGKVGVDGNGLSGIEARFDSLLSSKEFNQKYKRDALGNSLSVSSLSTKKTNIHGKGLKLTIDSDIQLIMDAAIKKTHESSKAKSVMALMLDSENGEILALSQTPLVNYNSNESLDLSDFKNPILETVFEPGSTMKPFVIAKALDLGLVRKDEVFNCKRNSFKIGRKIINDVHYHPKLDLTGVLLKSSNIGMSRIGTRFSRDSLYESLKSYGFGKKISLGLPGASSGIFRKPGSWAEIDLATHAFGQGIAVTALQMARAMSVFANDGMLPELKIMLNKEVSAPVQILSKTNSKLVKEMLIKNVELDAGTGNRARIKNVIVGGKTGTAQKASPNGGYYKDKYIASFLGFADLAKNGIDKKIVTYVIVNEPNNGEVYGGVLAAPAFKEIVEKTIRLLQMREIFAEKIKLPYKEV